MAVIDTNYIKLLRLPAIPDNLLPESLAEIRSYEYAWRNPQYTLYSAYKVSNELSTFISDLMKFNHYTLIHVIKDGLPIHVDGTRTECINYVLATGGFSPITTFFDNAKDNIVFEYPILKHTWHWLNVSINHTVLGIKHVRYAITIIPLNSVIPLTWLDSLS